MVEREVFYKGQLVVTRVSGEVKSQELVDHVFWLIDSHTIGEVQTDFNQLVYVDNLNSVNIHEKDVERLSEISTGLGQGRGKFRTAIIATEPNDLKLAQFYQSLVKDSGLEVEISSNFDEAFTWLGCDNPDPEKFR